MYHLAKIEWDEAVYPLVSAEMWRYIFAVKANAKKCLVLDLDNTLWGGIVGDNVWIGSGCVILDGATIGSGAIITPNSVVSSKIPENAIAQGNPAKVIFTRR